MLTTEWGFARDMLKTRFLIANFTFGKIPMGYEVRPDKRVGVEVLDERPKDLTTVTAAKAESQGHLLVVGPGNHQPFPDRILN